MKWIFLLFIFLLSDKIVVVSNSIDYSPELIEYLSSDFEVIPITADQFPHYQDYDFYVILGGPDAPEGIGKIVKTILTTQEQQYLRTTEEYNLFIRVKNGKTYFVLAGADREQTRKAVSDLKDDVRTLIPRDPIKWLDDFDEALAKAQSENKLVFIDFYTDWCKYCKEMDEKTYKDPRIIKLLTEDFVPVKLNREYPENEEIWKKYRVYVQPVELVVDAQGEAVWGYQGYLDAGELYFYLTSILSKRQCLV